MAPTIIGFGASTMAGARDSQGGFFKRLAVAMPERKFVNLGIGGHKTTDWLARLPLLEEHRPFQAIVILGVNDLPRGSQTRTPLADYAKALDEIFPKLAGETSLFVSSFPTDVARSAILRETSEAYMGEALRLARKHDFRVWDLYHEMLEDPKLPTYWAEDGGHFNDAGHALLAERVKTFL